MSDISNHLLQALVKIREDVQKSNLKPGIVDNISGIIFLVQKIKRFDEPKTIGFFGAQKRGKSSLINQLLGCDLMPTSPIPMSSVVIKVNQSDSVPDGQFKIDIIDKIGHLDAQTVDFESAQKILKQYASHMGCMSSGVDTISVASKFSNSSILANGGVLVDTPGAEVAFDPSSVDDSNGQDAQRAIEILKSTHIIVFVERADLMQSANSKEFFTNHLKPLRPLSVVNWKDAYNLDSKYNNTDPEWIEAKKQSCMVDSMLKTFGVNLDRILCVSSKEAADARKQEDNDLWVKSNLPRLETRILEELKNLNEDIGIKTCLNELQKILSLLPREIAQKVFLRAKTAFYVMIKISDSNPEIKKIAKEIYEQYR